MTDQRWIKDLADITYALDLTDRRTVAHDNARAAVESLRVTLAGQPDGFTHEDLGALHLALDPSFGPEGSYGAWVDSIKSLAQRIAALLPPEP